MAISSFTQAISQGQRVVVLASEALAYVEGDPVDLPVGVNLALIKQLHSNLFHTTKALELALQQTQGTIMPNDGTDKC